MEDLFERIWSNLIGRASGPLTFRFILQPAMAAFFGIRDGLRDAREGRPAYLWTVFTNPAERRSLLREGWKSIVKVFAMAFVIDGIYQFIVARWFYPGEALIVAFILAVVPYVFIRGPVTRLARPRYRGDAASDQAG